MLAARIWQNGALASIESMIYTNRICVANPGTTFGCWDDMWCFDRDLDMPSLLKIFQDWNYPETPEPLGWIRHPPTDRRRINGDPALEYRNFEEKLALLIQGF